MVSSRRRRMLTMQHGVIGGDPYVPGLPNASRATQMLWESGEPMLWESGEPMFWAGGSGIEYA